MALSLFLAFTSSLVAAGPAAPGTMAPPPAPLQVVATTPDLGALIRAIGGNLVQVTSLAKPTEDPHFVDAKPGLIVTLNRADILIDGGADLEAGWLPSLVESARNGKIAVGAPGRIIASDKITLLDVPTALDRSQGDVHSRGNPHFLMDPRNTRTVAGEIAAHLAQVLPASADVFATNLKTFQNSLDAKIVSWQKEMTPFKGSAIVTYHSDFRYLAEYFGLNVVATLEPKPGIAPSPAHLAKVMAAIKSNNVKAILVQPFQNRKTAETAARPSGVTVLDMPQQPGVLPGTQDWISMMDRLVTNLSDALKGAKK